MRDIRQQLIDEIMRLLIQRNCPIDGLKAELEIVLSKYEIEERKTELSVINEDDDQMLIRKFITAKIVKGLSDRTLKFYADTIRVFREEVKKSLRDVTADDIRLYLAIKQKRDGITKTTAGNYLRNLRSFYGWCHTEELIEKNPCAKVESIKQTRTKRKAFTEYQLELIRNACQTSMEKAMVELFISTGCRCGELVKMRRSELDGDKMIVHGKGSKDRLVYLTAKAQIAVAKYLAERSDGSDYIFPKCKYHFGEDGGGNKHKNLWFRFPECVDMEARDVGAIENTIRNIGKRAGVADCHPHRFRRTCATLALRRGMPIEQVSKMLGHEQLSTTQIYLDLTEQDLQLAHEKFVS